MLSYETSLHRWIKISVFNLLIVALLGVTLRAKILFPLPFIDQGFLLHGHSHFAFAGWITQALMTLLVAYLSKQSGQNQFTRYKFILIANLVAAYGMLFTFPFEGYAGLSISFSVLSIIVSYVFTIYFWKDLNKLFRQSIANFWMKGALVFIVLSSFGTFFLAYLMANKIQNEREALASVYFYLHFQYNGWFFFACMGLLSDKLELAGLPKKTLLVIFQLFTLACLPAYFLSALWMKIPVWMYVLVILAAIAEAAAWFYLLRLILKNRMIISAGSSLLAKWLLGLSAFALTIKFLLQIGCTIPSMSHLAYGFRPIVIAYLHLVLLGVITMFLIGYMFSMKFLTAGKWSSAGAIIFAAGIILNEIVLMIQGISDIDYHQFGHANELLFYVAIIMFSGVAILFSSQVFGKERIEI